MVGMFAPFLQTFSLAAGAGEKLYETIDRTPLISSASTSGLDLNPKDEMEIKFIDVSFAYPSRPDTKVLNGVTLSFEKGKTTALVGLSGSGKSTISKRAWPSAVK